MWCLFLLIFVGCVCDAAQILCPAKLAKGKMMEELIIAFVSFYNVYYYSVSYVWHITSGSTIINLVIFEVFLDNILNYATAQYIIKNVLYTRILSFSSKYELSHVSVLASMLLYLLHTYDKYISRKALPAVHARTSSSQLNIRDFE